MILIAAGSNSSGYVAAAELYNPATGTFSLTGSLNFPRSIGYTATLLNNGLVLIAGGMNAQSSAELYNPGTGTFNVTGNLNTRRWGHTAALLSSGLVLIAGGSNFCSGFFCNSLVDAELYNPAAGTFSATGSLNTARRNHAATALQNGTVLITGGFGALSSSELYLNNTNLIVGAAPGAGGTFESYDDAGNLLQSGTLSTPRSMHSATLLMTGNVFVAGGINDETSWQIFGQNGNVLSSGLLNDGRSSSSAIRLANGNAFLAGGVTGVPGVGSGTWEIHDPTGTLVASGSLNDVRGSGSSAVTLPNGNVWISGGSLGSGGACDYEIRSSSGGLVTSGTLLSCFPGGQIQVLSNGNVMLLGGDSAPGTYEIRTQTGAFVSTSSLVNGFNHGANSVVLNNGNVFIFGSCQIGRTDEPDPKDPSNTLYSWSCGSIGATSTWEIRDINGNFVSTGSLFNPRDGAGGVVLSNGNVFITGGNQALGTWEIRSPSGGLVSQGSLFNGDGGGHTLTHF